MQVCRLVDWTAIVGGRCELEVWNVGPGFRASRDTGTWSIQICDDKQTKLRLSPIIPNKTYRRQVRHFRKNETAPRVMWSASGCMPVQHCTLHSTIYMVEKSSGL
jgi:hypothetical protein